MDQGLHEATSTLLELGPQGMHDGAIRMDSPYLHILKRACKIDMKQGYMCNVFTVFWKGNFQGIFSLTLLQKRLAPPIEFLKATES